MPPPSCAGHVCTFFPLLLLVLLEQHHFLRCTSNTSTVLGLVALHKYQYLYTIQNMQNQILNDNI